MSKAPALALTIIVLGFADTITIQRPKSTIKVQTNFIGRAEDKANGLLE